MKNILPPIDVENFENLSLEDVSAVLMKALAIMDWDLPKEFIGIWHPVAEVLVRFANVLLPKAKTEGEFTDLMFGISPFIRFTEFFYDANAENYEKDVSPEELEENKLAALLMDIQAEISTMHFAEYDFHGDEEKRERFDSFLKISRNLFEFLTENGIKEFPEESKKDIKMMSDVVKNEFQAMITEKQ